MNKTAGQIFLFSLLSIIVVNSNASGLFGEIGIHFGGDKVDTATFTTGDTESIRGGELFSIAGGIVNDMNEHVQMRISAGYKIDLITAENGDLDFNRLPLELLFFKKGETWNVGGGITHHVNPEYNGSGLNTFSIDFDNATGFILEADYILRTGAYLGIKMTFIEYETDDPTYIAAFGDGIVSGDSVGVVVGVKF